MRVISRSSKQKNGKVRDNVEWEPIGDVWYVVMFGDLEPVRRESSSLYPRSPLFA
jgi:hypothetical protein